MATVNFLYRSTKDKACLNLRLLFRKNDKDYVIGAKSRIEVTKNYWNNYHTKKRIQDIDLKNTQTEIRRKLASIEDYILLNYRKDRDKEIDKKWLVKTLESHENPQENDPKIPIDLIGYIDYYLVHRANEITPANKSKVNVTKNKMLRFQKELGRTIYIQDINENFKKLYVNFSTKNSYAQNTQHRELVLIKTICFHARYMGLKTHHQLDKLRLNREQSDHIYLTKKEIQQINETRYDEDYLDNTRDWLIISCYTGQRISDFMRFTKNMIKEDNGKLLLEFRQKKTGKWMSIPVLKEVRNILLKRDGNFPRRISDQNYNDYVKIVCKRAELKEKVKGKKRVSVAPKGVKPTKYDYRDKISNFEKWEIVSSHIGRRSFATNYYGQVPTSYLINITGHCSEKMFLAYIKKSNRDLALDSHNYFE